MNIVNKLLLITAAVILANLDKRANSHEATQQTLREPLSPKPSKYAYQVLKPSQELNRPYLVSINPATGIITSTTATSKYTPEQLQAMYKINPYTNKPYNL